IADRVAIIRAPFSPHRRHRSNEPRGPPLAASPDRSVRAPSLRGAILGVMSRALGRYELLRPLARGGMAEIYLARRRAAGIERLLVVKRLRAERAGDTRFLELFVREARLSMSLAHQNIVPVFDFGRSGDQVFLAMERVEGKDLGGSLARPGAEPLPPVV